jgi:hypothetical protein
MAYYEMTTLWQPTHVSVGYLQQLQASLSDILAQVNAQLAGQSGGPATPEQIVDSDLGVQAGGGGVAYDAAEMLNRALSTMGGSAQAQLTWLSGTVTAMIGQITTSIDSLSGTNTLNTEQADALIAEFDTDTGGQFKMKAVRPPTLMSGILVEGKIL